MKSNRLARRTLKPGPLAGGIFFGVLFSCQVSVDLLFAARDGHVIEPPVAGGPSGGGWRLELCPGRG